MFLEKLLRPHLLFLIILMLVGSSVEAQVLVSAKILSSTGPVEIRRLTQGQATMTRIKYRANDELYAGDIIKTQTSGRLVLGLMDGSQAVIGENTTVEIKDLSKSPRTIFNVMRGKTRIKIEKSGGRPNSYRINTPTAVIAVRGTLFDVIVKDKETQVFVHEGEVAVSNFLNLGEAIILSAGQRTRVQAERAPEPPASFKPGRNNDLFNRIPNGKRPDAASPEARERIGLDGSPGQSGSAPGRGGWGVGAPGNSGNAGNNRGGGRRP